MIINKENVEYFGLTSSEYSPTFLFRNHHINTMYPFLFRSGAIPIFKRERWNTEDGDFFDLDFVNKNSSSVLIILHGLEGSSSSQYVRGLTNIMADIDIDICAVNHRSCSGELNKTIGFYHSGFTTDLRFIVQKLSFQYEKIFIAGFSLGGNMALKYAGEEGENISKKVIAVAAVSVPCHLSSSAKRLNEWYNMPYSIQFLQTLKKKAIAKSNLFNNSLPYTNEYVKIKTLLEYDNKVTAPLHGFKDAEDYYAKSSSLPLLENIKTQTILINANDDSFLSDECMPFDIAENNGHFHFLQTRFGGHVGFAKLRSSEYWIDKRLREWVIKKI